MSDMRLIVVGAAGRMGRELIRRVAETEGASLVAAIERKGAPEVGADAGELAGIGNLSVPVTTDALEAFARADGVLDFTVPAATVAFSELAAQARIAHIAGTTGLSDADAEKLEAAARHAVVVKSGNMSLGVNLLAALTKKVAAALDADYDIEIVEMHHRNKVDAPSGTAHMLGHAAAEGRGVALNDHSAWTRHGHTGQRKRGDIGFQALRGGTVVGDHTVIFAGPHERVELTHRAEDRGIFSRGAVKAALWARGRKPGLYTMADVLGLND